MGDLIKTGVLCTRVITVFDLADAPKTGLVSADFTTKDLTKDGAVDATAVTVTEINAGTRPGRYKVTWTPAAAGEYELRVAHPTYSVRGWIFEFTVTADGPLTLALIRADLDANSTKLANLDATVSSRLATAGYTTPPTVAQIRTEIDSNSADLNTIIAGIAAVQADTDNIQTRLPAALVSGRMDSDVGAMQDNVLTDDAIAADVDTYQGKLTLCDDDSGTADRYTMCWFKNSQPLFAGITDCKIKVRDLEAASDLIALDDMDDDGNGDFTYDEPTSRIESGKTYRAYVEATIDGATRKWKQPVSRDTA